LTSSLSSGRTAPHQLMQLAKMVANALYQNLYPTVTL
jgi:hypothetical protein